MKKGDIVTIADGSYSRSVINGKLVHELLNYGNEQGKQYVIVETDCSFPLETDRFCDQPDTYRNDVVIQAVDSNKVIFIHNRFLRPVLPKHKVIINVTITRLGGIYGDVVEISDKLYKEIKRDSQTK